MIKTTLTVEGMMCGMCESHVNDAVRSVAKVKKVNSSHNKNTTEIISDDALNTNAVVEAINKTGYKVTDVKTEEYVKKGLFGR